MAHLLITWCVRCGSQMPVLGLTSKHKDGCHRPKLRHVAVHSDDLHLEVPIVSHPHFKPLEAGEQDQHDPVHWHICPDCDLIYLITVPGIHYCIEPHRDQLVPATPLVDPQPSLANSTFCRQCGFIINSPAADLVHSERCGHANMQPVYIGEKLWPTVAASGSV